MMKPIFKYLLKKTGIYQSIWNEFCDKYPIRLSIEEPKVKEYLKTQEKVFTDMMLYGVGCTQYVDPKTVIPVKDVVRH